MPDPLITQGASDDFEGWKVGDQVNHCAPWRSWSPAPYGGTVLKLYMDRDDDTALPVAVVRWPDGKEDEMGVEYLEPADSPKRGMPPGA